LPKFIVDNRVICDNRVIPKVTLPLGLLPPPIPLFQCYQQTKEILLNPSMCVAAVEALRRKERQDETQFTSKIGGKTSLGPNYFAS
jgi:hypothetical protein